MEIKDENDDQNDSKSTENPKKVLNRFRLERKEDREKRKKRRSRLIIRNISYKATNEALREHFAKFGKVIDLNLLKRPDGKLVGCAFVQFEKVNEAAKAILKATNKEFLGRPIYVDWAVGKDEYVKRKGGNEEVKEEEIKEEAENNEIDIKSDEDDDEMDVKSESEESGSEINEDGSKNSNEESESESSDDSGLDEKPKIKTEDDDDDRRQRKISNDVKEGCTIFIKNVPFDATQDDMRKCCRKFGPIYYALINIDPVSGHSRGTAFVKFKSKDSADLCLKAGEEFTLFGTVMDPMPALSREDVRNQRNADKQKNPSDSRNLYLVKEGLIMAGSNAADGVSAADMNKRHKLEQIKTQILKNLNRFISRNRLSVHNLPFNYDDDKLKQMIIKHTNLKPHECRVMRENRPSVGNPGGKSKGFGFISFKSHQDALTALRKLNNNPNVFTPNARPIVAFSIEDRSVHKIKEKRLKKSRDSNPTYQTKLEKLKAKKNKKKKSVTSDDKAKIQRVIETKTDKSKKIVVEEQLDDFVGMPAKPGTFVKMRSNRKIREQAQEHTKRLSEQKRKDKQRKERRLHRIEKRQIDRPKMGKKKTDKDHFSKLVNKYKQLIDSRNEQSTTVTTGGNKGKRSKWYVE